MYSLDKDALICDLAEFYNIYDFSQYPLTYIATLACGLREESRIKMKILGQKASPDTLILSAIYDRVGLLLWSLTKDGQRGRNRPKSLFRDFFSDEKEERAFDSVEDFNETRQRMLNKIRKEES